MTTLTAPKSIFVAHSLDGKQLIMSRYKISKKFGLPGGGGSNCDPKQPETWTRATAVSTPQIIPRLVTAERCCLQRHSDNLAATILRHFRRSMTAQRTP